MKPWQKRQLDRLAQAHAAGHYRHPAPSDDSFELSPIGESTIGRTLTQAARSVGRRLDAARDPAEMARLITLRKSVRLALESIAAKS
jgi:hypothetical protein